MTYIEPSIIETHVFNLGLCVPKAWTIQQIEDWINKTHQASYGSCRWQFVREAGDCEQHSGFKHVWVRF